MRRKKIDKRQKVLIPKTMAETGPGIITTTEFTVSIHEQVFCPFCIHTGKLQEFLVSDKKGVSQRNAKCPECKQSMLLRTLTKEFTPEQFAEWIHNDYGKWFWKKVSWSQFRDRLFKIGWAHRFWKRYRELKGEPDEEEYAQYIERTQEEWAKEKGLINE